MSKWSIPKYEERMSEISRELGWLLTEQTEFLERDLAILQKSFVTMKLRVNASVNCLLSWKDSGKQGDDHCSQILYVSRCP
jgi:hypothetical protein